MEIIRVVADQLFEWLSGLGYWGILLGLMVEIIPSEIVLAYGGYLVSEGHIRFVGAIVFGTIGGVAAQVILYGIARYGGRGFLEKYGKYLFIRRHHLYASERWFRRYGAGVIFFARFIPVLRHAISVPAGIARMPLGTFTLLTTAAVLPWTMIFVYVGYILGDNWKSIDEEIKPFIEPVVIIAILLGTGYIILKFLQSYRQRQYGKPGEQQVAQSLRSLGNEYFVFHGRKLSAGGSRREFDHIVVGPAGIFHIETKHWAGEIRLTSSGLRREEGKPNHDPVRQLQGQSFILKQLIQRHHIKTDIVGLICFTHPRGKIIGRNSNIPIVTPDQLVPWITSYRGKHSLSSYQVKEVIRIIRRG